MIGLDNTTTAPIRRRSIRRHHVQIRTKKGLDLALAGQPARALEAGTAVKSVALLGTDYPGLKPRMLVEPGDRVTAGQPLFVDKRDEAVPFVAPGTGTVVEVNRGARRALQSVVVDLDEPAVTVEPRFEPISLESLARLEEASVRDRLRAGGLWPALRARPYGHVPPSDGSPYAIFVTAIDTHPLAGDPSLAVAPQASAFAAGLQVLSRLTTGTVFLCTGPAWTGPVPEGNGERVRHVIFDGPHPAGLPGTHIHHLAPAGPARTVWYTGYQDVIAMGRLFTEGVLWLERAVALGGEGFARPRTVQTRLGAAVRELTRDELRDAPAADRPWRLVSGSLLGGRSAAGAEAYLGRYHQQVCAIAPAGRSRLFGWLGGRGANPSYTGPFRRWRRRGGDVSLTTALGGRPMAMIPVDAFEHLIPMDILPVPLLRALLIQDTQTAQALGCLELEPEDLALCTFMCPGKNDYGAVLRVNLDQIEREG